MLADREIKCNGMKLVATPAKPLVSQGEDAKMIHWSTGGKLPFFLMLLLMETVKEKLKVTDTYYMHELVPSCAVFVM